MENYAAKKLARLPLPIKQFCSAMTPKELRLPLSLNKILFVFYCATSWYVFVMIFAYIAMLKLITRKRRMHG